MIRFEVWGTKPAKQGSKTVFGKGRFAEADKGLAAWRREVRQAAIDAKTKGFEPYAGAVLMKATFYFQRPAKPKDFDHPTSLRNGDLDKLTRALSDACTQAGVWVDDSQVVDLIAAKRYAEDGVPGAEVEVWPL